MTVIVGMVMGMLLVGAFMAIRNQVLRGKLKGMLNDHRFESESGRVRFHIKHHRVHSLIVSGNPYDSFEEALATETFTKDEHEVLVGMQKLMEKERKIMNQNQVLPPTHREFKDTPIGDLRIYNMGPVKVSSRLVVVIGKNKEGNMVIGRAFLAKKDLITDNHRFDFRLETADDITEDEALEHVDGFVKYFIENETEYAKEIVKYKEISDALELYNKNKDKLTLERGKLIFKGNVALPKHEPTALLKTSDPARDEVEQMIRAAVLHK